MGPSTAELVDRIVSCTHQQESPMYKCRGAIIQYNYRVQVKVVTVIPDCECGGNHLFMNLNSLLTDQREINETA